MAERSVVHNINMNALRVFAAAARHGNFQRAAEELHISQGAISQRIKQLELSLGVVLFERKARGVSLTANGATYHNAVKSALQILETAGADLVRESSHITLHLGSSFAARWLMPRIKVFAALFPDIALSTQVHEQVLARNLGRNEVSIWPATQVDNTPAHHVCRLTQAQLVAVCSPTLLRPDWPLDTETLLSLPLLQDAHRRWERLIDATGHHRKPVILNFDRSALALDAAMNGHGVAIVPTYMIGQDLSEKRLQEIWRNPDPSGEFLFMSWSKQQTADKALKQTVNWILSEFDQEPAD